MEMGIIGLGIGAGLAVGLAGIGTAIAQGRVGAASLEAVGRNPEAEKKINSRLMMILGMCESAAIYGLLIAGFLGVIAKQIAGI